MMTAYCGLDCEACDAFIATQKNDDALRAKVAEEWARLYNAPIKPEHINCTGCKSDGIKTYYCDQLCKIRPCNIERKFDNCAACDDFVCDKINEILKFAPKLKDTLEAMRKPR